MTRKLIFFSLLLVTIAASSFLSYRMGLNNNTHQASSNTDQEQALLDEVQNWRGKYYEAQKIVKVAERAREVEVHAKIAIENMAKQMQVRIYELEDELKLYQSVFDVAQSNKGFQLKDINFRENGIADQFQYQIVLLNHDKQHLEQIGELQFVIHGKQAGKSVDYALEKLQKNKHKKIDFNFRYLEKLSGVIEIPKDFQPEKVTLTVKRLKPKLKNMEQEYVWETEKS